MLRRINIAHLRTSAGCILSYPMNRVMRIRTEQVGTVFVERKRFANKLQSTGRVSCEYDRVSWRCVEEREDCVTRFIGV